MYIHIFSIHLSISLSCQICIEQKSQNPTSARGFVCDRTRMPKRMDMHTCIIHPRTNQTRVLTQDASFCVHMHLVAYTNMDIPISPITCQLQDDAFEPFDVKCRPERVSY